MSNSTFKPAARATLLGLSLSALALGPALAADETALDLDGDGMVSFEELASADPSLTHEHFSLLDADGDGALNADEVAAAIEAGHLVLDS